MLHLRGGMNDKTYFNNRDKHDEKKIVSINIKGPSLFR